MKRNDVILLLVILCLGGIGLLFTRILRNQNGSFVRITVAGEVYGEYPLDKNQEITAEHGEWINIAVIENGSVFMREANCPDQYCVLHKKITKTNDPIVCLPHRLVVEIVRKSGGTMENAKENVDGVAE